MKKIEKSIFVQNLSEILKSSSSYVLVNFSGMGVKKQQEFKSRLKEAGAKMLVVKNTLFRLAGKLAKTPNEILSEKVLSGQTAIISTEEDPISPLKVINDFSKEDSVPELKAGVIEGHFQDKDSLSKLSIIPSKEALFSNLNNLILSPIYGLMHTLKLKQYELIFLLNSAKNKK
jgi:large subunit ribosomal protein L10